MSVFAKIENNIVVDVIIATSQEWVDEHLDGVFIETFAEPLIIKRMNDQGEEYDYKPDHARKNYAGVGYTYDPEKDAFIGPQPFPSWTLNEDTCKWESPVPKPDDDSIYIWEEGEQIWVKVEATQIE